MIVRRSLFALVLLAGVAPLSGALAETSVKIGDIVLVNKGLVAAGRLPAALRDKAGETFGSGSGMTLDPSTWRRDGESLAGEIYLLPDRGYNVEGTADYSARLNKLSVKLTPVAPGATPPAGAEQKSLEATLADTIMLKDASGAPMTGVDPTQVRPAAGSLPALPQSDKGKVSIDAEAIVRLPGGFLISDEYGPSIFRFDAQGALLGVTHPPKALQPMRKGEVNFSSNNPGPGAPKPTPANPETGRQNNQGLEGMSLAPDGKTLTVVLQSATRQDGGDNWSTRRYTRALVYDASDVANLKLTAEYVVPLPVFKSDDGKDLVAAQSELLSIGDNLHLLLNRDGNNGQGLKSATSRYRSIDVLDFAGATNIANTAYDADTPVAPKGVLAEGVRPATLRPFIDMNDSRELARFGLHNGEPNDVNNLSEKWEAMGVVPAMDPATPDDYFLLVANDNDFMTTKGFQVGASYDAGADVDTMILAYRVTLPGLKKR